MFKLFSLEEANRLIPTVDTIIGEMQADIRDTLRLRQELSQLPPHRIAAYNKMHELQFLLKTIHDSKLQLDRLGVFIQDVDTGLIDFPSQLGAEVVYLSWEKGQERIQHYHRLNEGTRLPIFSAQVELS